MQTLCRLLRVKPPFDFCCFSKGPIEASFAASFVYSWATCLASHRNLTLHTFGGEKRKRGVSKGCGHLPGRGISSGCDIIEC